MLGPQFDGLEDDEGPYCPSCSTDIGEWGDSLEYWANERANIKPEDRLACKGCGVK